MLPSSILEPKGAPKAHFSGQKVNFFWKSWLARSIDFFNTKSTFCLPWELPGASKKRSEIAMIFHDFLASILDRFWLILDLQNYLKITKITFHSLSKRVFRPLWGAKSDPELIFHDVGPQKWFVTQKRCFPIPQGYLSREFAFPMTYVC